MDDMQLVGAPVYRLSMIAEAYATKGMSTHSHTHTLILNLASLNIGLFRPKGCMNALLHTVAV